MENSKAEKLIEQLNSLPTGALSLGSFIHEDLKLTPKPPFVGPARQSCLSKFAEYIKLHQNNSNVRQLHSIYGRETFKKQDHITIKRSFYRVYFHHNYYGYNTI